MSGPGFRGPGLPTGDCSSFPLTEPGVLPVGIGATRLNEVVRGRRGITADTALRLARYLGSDPQFWMNLQMQYELDLAASSKLGEIERRVQPREKTA